MADPLVLLPGMMCDARLFLPQIVELSASFAVCTFPLTGHDTVSELALDIIRRAPPEFSLAGLSMGGIVAMEVMRLAPARVKRLALLDTNPLAEPTARQVLREPQIAAVNTGRLRQVMRDEMKPHYLSDGPDREKILRTCMEMAESLGAEAFISQSRALQSRPDQTESLAQIAVPTLILCGREDMLCPVSRHEMMHRLITGSTLTIVEQAGHLPTLERPVETTAALRQWMGTN